MASSDISPNLEKFITQLSDGTSPKGFGVIDLALWVVASTDTNLTGYCLTLRDTLAELHGEITDAQNHNSTHAELHSFASRVRFVRTLVQFTVSVAATLIRKGVTSDYEFLGYLKTELTELVQWVKTCHPGRNMISTQLGNVILNLDKFLLSERT